MAQTSLVASHRSLPQAMDPRVLPVAPVRGASSLGAAAEAPASVEAEGAGAPASAGPV